MHVYKSVIGLLFLGFLHLKGIAEEGATTVSIAFVVTTYPTGTGVLRGKHFVDLLNNSSEEGISLSAQLVRSQDMVTSFKDSKIGVCVIVKVINQDILNWCKAKEAYIIYDALDNQKILNVVADSRDLSAIPSHTLPRVDMMLTSNTDMKEKVESSAGGIESAVLYHQHTNPGVVRPRECIESNVSTVGLLVGADLNLPAKETLSDIRNYICGELGDHCGVGVLCLSQQLRKGNEARMKLRRLGCKGKRSGPTLENKAYCEKHQYWKTMSSVRETDKDNQLQFHIGKGLDTVDIGIIWPGTYDNSSFHRPSTRLLYWMSHGIPCVFYPNHAYLEISHNMNYTFPLESKFRGLVPAASSLELMSAMIVELVRSPSSRLHLRNRGIDIAAKYTTESIANELRRIIVQQRRGKS